MVEKLETRVKQKVWALTTLQVAGVVTRIRDRLVI